MNKIVLEAVGEILGEEKKATRKLVSDTHDQIIKAVEEKLAAIELKAGPKGKDGEDGQPGEKGQPGEEGTPGRDGRGIKSLKKSGEDRLLVVLDDGSDFEVDLPHGPQGLKGDDGKDADPEAVADVIVKRHLEVVKGPKGEPGEKGAPGADGKDAEPEKVADLLVDKHLSVIKGPQGEPGEKGEPGQDAPEVAPETLAAIMVEKHLQKIKGPQGDTGAPGEAGPKGEDGLDRPLIEPYTIKAGDSISKNALGIYAGGLWQASRQTKGDPQEDPASWRCVVNGVEGGVWEKKGREWHLRIDLSDGNVVKNIVSDMPTFKGYDDDDLIPGDITVTQDDEGKSWFHVRSFDDEWLSYDITGSTGPRGRKGMKGDDGRGIKSVRINGDTLEGMMFRVEMSDGEKINLPIDNVPLVELFKDFIADTILGTQEDIDAPIRRFAGQWRMGNSYAEGDVVARGNELWLATAATSENLGAGDAWTVMSGTAAGSGGPPDVIASPFNVGTTLGMRPAAGAGRGDTFYDLSTGYLYVWDDTKGEWITPPITATVVPDTAGLNGITLTPNGKVVYQADTNQLWIYNGGKWNLPGGVAIVDDLTGLSGITGPAEGDLAYQKDNDTLWIREGTAWIPTGGGSITIATSLANLNGLAASAVVGDMAWRSDNEQMYVFNGGIWNAVNSDLITFADATARAAATTQANGTIGYQQDTQALYIRDAGAWVEVSGSGGVVAVNDEAARYAQPVISVEQGSLFYQLDTEDLWQFTGPFPITAAGVATPANWTKITSDSLTPKVVEVDDETQLPSFAAAHADTSQPLYLIKFDINGAPLDQLVWFRDETPLPTVADPNPTPTGTWVIPTSTTYLKALIGSPDAAGALKVGDIQGTIEPDHAELKMFDGNAWQLLFSEDEIRMWIAAGSLFQGTVMPQPVLGGAIDLFDLPVPDSQWKGYYWTWTGPSNWQVTDGTLAGDPAQEPGFVPITVTTNPLPAAWPVPAGQPLQVYLTTPGDVAIGVEREVSAEITVRQTSGTQSVYVHYEASANDTPQDIMQGLVANWVPGELDLDAAMSAGNDHVILTPRTPTTEILSIIDFPAGATPVIGPDLAGDTMQVGDWLQVVTDPGGGYRWAHVPSDLLSKLRGDRLYSIQPWAAGTWEVNSVVNYEARLWRARRGILPGDPAPQLPGVPTTIRGVPPMPSYPATVAEVETWLATPPTIQNRGDFIIIDAGAAGTYNLPAGGTITAAAGDAILCVGDPALGTEGYAHVVGPFTVSTTAAQNVQAFPANTNVQRTNALPVLTANMYRTQVLAANQPGQRIVAVRPFTVGPGLPFAGTAMGIGDTVWFAGDPAHGDNGWVHVPAVTPAAGQPVMPPFVSQSTPITQRIYESVFDSQLTILLNDLSNTTAGSIYTTTSGGILGVAALNAPVGTIVNQNDYIEVVDPAAGTFTLNTGPYSSTGTVPVTLTTTFRRSFGKGFQDTGTDDIADMLDGSRVWAVGGQYGYMGDTGVPKQVPAGWTVTAGNLAGTALPNNQGQKYIITKLAVPSYFQVDAVASFPANGTQGRITGQVPAVPVSGSLAANGQKGILWSSLMNDPLSAVDETNSNVNVNIAQHTMINVAQAPSAPLAGPNAGNLAGETPQAGDLLILVTQAPPVWLHLTGQDVANAGGMLYEGNTVADPATLTYNSPAIVTADAPYPQAVIPGVPLASMPWEEIPVEGDFHSVLTDLQLPAGGAASDQVYFVANSALAGGEPAFLAWDGVAWVRLGGNPQGSQLPFGPVFPTGGSPGDVFLRSDLGLLFMFRLGEWIQIPDVAGKIVEDNAGASPIVTQAPSNIEIWQDGEWTAASLVVHKTALWRSRVRIKTGDPEPGLEFSANLTLAKLVDWDTDLDVDIDALILSGRGSYAEVTNGDVADPTIGGPYSGTVFPNGNYVVWTGDPSLNGHTADGYSLVHGLLYLPASGAPYPTPFKLITHGPWTKLGVFDQGGAVTTSNTAPAQPAMGDLWYDTTAGSDGLKVWESSKWLAVTHASYGSTDPANPVNGQLHIDTSGKGHLKFFSSTNGGWQWAPSFQRANKSNLTPYSQMKWGDSQFAEDTEEFFMALNGSDRKKINYRTDYYESNVTNGYTKLITMTAPQGSIRMSWQGQSLLFLNYAARNYVGLYNVGTDSNSRTHKDMTSQGDLFILAPKSNGWVEFHWQKIQGTTSQYNVMIDGFYMSTSVNNPDDFNGQYEIFKGRAWVTGSAPDNRIAVGSYQGQTGKLMIEVFQ